MLAAERRRLIGESIRSRGVVSVAEMAHTLGTTEITLRRDLRLMARDGLLVRTHGGAVRLAGLGHEASYWEKAHQAAGAQAATAGLAGAAQQVVVLADHTKIGQETMCQTVPAARVDMLITDSRARERELEDISAAGVEVRVAQVEGDEKARAAAR